MIKEMKKDSLAVVMITLNEAHNLERSIKNLKGWADEIFVVDSYSQDKTVDICLKHNIPIIQKPFLNFCDQWNFALRNLKIESSWVMKIDPDEFLSDDLKQSIKLNITAVYTFEQTQKILKKLNRKTKSIISIFAGRMADKGKDPLPIFKKSIFLTKKNKNIETCI